MEPTGNAGEYIAAVGKLAPPGTVTGLAVAGVSVQDWVCVVTIVYTLILLAHQLWKWNKERRGS